MEQSIFKPNDNPEKTPLPWSFKQVHRLMKLQGWTYNKLQARFEYTDIFGIQWTARLRETEYGTNIDARIINNVGKETMI